MLRQVPKTVDSVREVSTFWTPQSDRWTGKKIPQMTADFEPDFDRFLDKFWIDFGPILNRCWTDFEFNFGSILVRF